MDGLKEECGVFGIFNSTKMQLPLNSLGTYTLYNIEDKKLVVLLPLMVKIFMPKEDLGLVGDNFTKGKILSKLPGK